MIVQRVALVRGRRAFAFRGLPRLDNGYARTYSISYNYEAEVSCRESAMVLARGSDRSLGSALPASSCRRSRPKRLPSMRSASSRTSRHDARVRVRRGRFRSRPTRSASCRW
ncbi:protein of unknown function [Methylorubrum extorquens]|uniref:Uncharacterized protein n=1 Tax=Methylorubrum extorquens TaxID=408 RepID=A0A2N9AST8_METEX|nr:protein of unknown function [Methylorubrum extorquens]